MGGFLQRHVRRTKRTGPKSVDGLLRNLRPATVNRWSGIALLIATLLVAPSALADVELAMGQFDGRGKAPQKLKQAVTTALIESGAVSISKGAALTISGRGVKVKRRWRAIIKVVDSSGTEVITHVFKGGKKARKLWAKVESTLWSTIGDSVTSAHAAELKKQAAAAKPDPKKDPDPVPDKPDPKKDPDVKPPEDSSGPRAASLSPLQVALGGRVFTRSFEYTDDIYGVMRNYNVDAAAMVAGEVTWFPGAHFTDGAGAHFGLRFRGHGVIGLSSQTTDGTSYATTAYGLEGGLVGRIPIFDHEILIDVSAGTEVYDVEAPESGQLVPNLGYTWIRPGVGFRVAFGYGLSMSGDFGWLFVLDTGELGTDAWFPRLTGGGLSGSVFLAIDVYEGLEIQAGFEARRYWTAMRPELGDKYIVGGVVDQFLMGTVRLGYRMP